MHPHVHSLGQALLRMCWSVQRPSQMLHLLESLGGFHFEELRATSGTLPPIYILFHRFHVSDGHFIDGQRPHQLWKKTKLQTPKLAFLRKTTCLDWCQTLIHLGNNFLCSVGVLELMCLLSPQALDRGHSGTAGITSPRIPKVCFWILTLSRTTFLGFLALNTIRAHSINACNLCRIASEIWVWEFNRVKSSINDLVADWI